jgi:hypothetical protein
MEREDWAHIADRLATGIESRRPPGVHIMGTRSDEVSAVFDTGEPHTRYAVAIGADRYLTFTPVELGSAILQTVPSAPLRNQILAWAERADLVWCTYHGELHPPPAHSAPEHPVPDL